MQIARQFFLYFVVVYAAVVHCTRQYFLREVDGNKFILVVQIRLVVSHSNLPRVNKSY